MRPIDFLRIALMVSGVFVQAVAALALPFDATSGIEARGRADVDGFGSAPSLSNLTETEATQPFSRSVVSVTDSDAGLFEYFASADIGTLALRASATLTNSGPTDFFGSGTAILQAVAELRDIVTLTTTRTDPFDVTLQLVVNGSLAGGAGSQISANSVITLGAEGQLNTTDAARYATIGQIQDTLSVTKTVSGSIVLLEIDALLSTTVLGVAAGDTVSGQLANTAFLSLILPSDVTITASDSGTFGVPIPIPEPSTVLLSGLGLLLILGVARRHGR